MLLSKKEEIKKFLDSTPKYIEYFAQHSIDLSIQISKLLKKYNMSQKDLAKLVNKKESEISKWLSGNHNLTLKSIAKLEAAFNEQIIFTQDELFEQLSNNTDNKTSNIHSTLTDFISTYPFGNTISLKNGHQNNLRPSKIPMEKDVNSNNLSQLKLVS